MGFICHVIENKILIQSDWTCFFFLNVRPSGLCIYLDNRLPVSVVVVTKKTFDSKY